MFVETISFISIWSSLHSWLTPTFLFLLLNLMIGTIALTSSFTSHKFHHHNRHNTTVNHHIHHQQPPQLIRAPSVIQRLKSINFYSYYSHTPQVHATPPEPNPPPQSDPLTQAQTHPYTRTHVVVQDSTIDEDVPTLDEIYSRIKGTTPTPNYTRQKSDTKPSRGDIPVKLSAKMKKSASHKSAFNHFQAVEKHDNVAPAVVEKATVVTAAAQSGCEVDARADDFINRFKKQLQLQKMESIVRYKEMITRGSQQ